VDNHDPDCHKAHIDKPMKAMGKDHSSPVRAIEFGYMVHDTCNHLTHFESVDTFDKLRKGYGDGFVDVHFIEPHEQIDPADCYEYIGDLYFEENQPRWIAFWAKYDDRTSQSPEGMSVYLLAARHWTQAFDYFGICPDFGRRALVFVDKIRDELGGNSHLPHTAVHEVGHHGWGRPIYHCDNEDCVMIQGGILGYDHPKFDNWLFDDGCRHTEGAQDPVNHLDEVKLRIHWGPTHPDGGDDFPMWADLFTSPPPDAHP